MRVKLSMLVKSMVELRCSADQDDRPTKRVDRPPRQTSGTTPPHERQLPVRGRGERRGAAVSGSEGSGSVQCGARRGWTVTDGVGRKKHIFIPTGGALPLRTEVAEGFHLIEITLRIRITVIIVKALLITIT